MLVANVGTGTPFVFVDGQKSAHVAGSGVGGGTLAGLARLLLNTRVEKIEELARKGTPRLDLTVAEAVGGGVGIVGGEATASNFGKAAGAKKVHSEDVALSTVNLVAEAVGTMALLAAKNCGCEKDIVFTGRAVARNRLMQEKIGEVMRLFGGRAVFPENAEYCTAIGAMLALEK
jgi:type II pantothenate kinase